MNTTTHTAQALTDYRDTMQAMADGYLQRHWDEHLDEGQLFDRTCRYLVAHDVPVFMAQRLVYLAMSKIMPPTVRISWDWACDHDRTAVVMVDSRDGIHRVVSSRLLPERFFAHAVSQ